MPRTKAPATRSPRPNTFSANHYVFATARRTGASVRSLTRSRCITVSLVTSRPESPVRTFLRGAAVSTNAASAHSASTWRYLPAKHAARTFLRVAAIPHKLAQPPRFGNSGQLRANRPSPSYRTIPRKTGAPLTLSAPEPGQHFFREEVELSSPAPFPLRRRPVATFAGRLTFAASASPEPGQHFFREEVELSSPAPFPLRRRPVATFAGRLTFAASAAPEPGQHFFRRKCLSGAGPALFPRGGRTVEPCTFSSPAPSCRHFCRKAHFCRKCLSGAGPSLFSRGGRTVEPCTFSAPAPSLHPFLISRQPTPPVTPSSPSLPDHAAHPFSRPFQDLRSPPSPLSSAPSFLSLHTPAIDPFFCPEMNNTSKSYNLPI